MAKKRSTGFGSRLRELRQTAGLTQAELAERAGMHLHGITKLEQGDREPAWSTVLDLAQALGVSVETFVAPGEDSTEALPSAPQTRNTKDKSANQAPVKKPGRSSKPKG